MSRRSGLRLSQLNEKLFVVLAILNIAFIGATLIRWLLDELPQPMHPPPPPINSSVEITPSIAVPRQSPATDAAEAMIESGDAAFARRKYREAYEAYRRATLRLSYIRMGERDQRAAAHYDLLWAGASAKCRLSAVALVAVDRSVILDVEEDLR